MVIKSMRWEGRNHTPSFLPKYKLFYSPYYIRRHSVRKGLAFGKAVRPPPSGAYFTEKEGRFFHWEEILVGVWSFSVLKPVSEHTDWSGNVTALKAVRTYQTMSPNINTCSNRHDMCFYSALSERAHVDFLTSCFFWSCSLHPPKRNIPSFADWEAGQSAHASNSSCLIDSLCWFAWGVADRWWSGRRKSPLSLYLLGPTLARYWSGDGSGVLGMLAHSFTFC